jgi:redox-sensitive bicupin YhaK (pirin superfamily)
MELADNKRVVNVIARNYNGIMGPATTYSTVNLFDVKLNKDGEVNTDLTSDHNAVILLVNGSVEVNGNKVDEHNFVLFKHNFVLFKNEGDEISVRAMEDSVLLVLSGQPLKEPIASHGPFVMNTQEEIAQAIKDFRSGKFGRLGM